MAMLFQKKTAGSFNLRVATLVLLMPGCGTLPEMIPLDRHLTDGEVAYVETLQSSSKMTLHANVLGTQVNTHSGDFFFFGALPFYRKSQVVGYDSVSIVGSDTTIVPALYPFFGFGLMDAASFSREGRLRKKRANWFFAPLVYSSSVATESRILESNIGLIFYMFGWGSNADGWYGRVFWIPFGPGA